MKIKKLSVIVTTMLLIVGCSDNLGEQMSVSGERNIVGGYQEMNTTDFWISGIKDPDKLIMSATEIKAFNESIPNTKGTACVNLDEYKKSLSKEELLDLLNLYAITEEVRYLNDIELDAPYYEKLLLNRNEKGIQDQNHTKLGVIIQNSEVRNFPTADVSYSEINDIEFDMGIESVLKTGERVVVLHESEDREWLYVQAYNYIGWVATKDIAICTEEEWNLISENEDWITITGNRVILDVNHMNANVSRKELTMGTRLLLLKEKPASIDGVSTLSSHVVLFPTRDETGALKLVETRIPQGLDVTIGYLEYTPRNVINQSFKMLGERYGWGGLFHARDCASFIMDIYQCFGISLPRNAQSQAAVSGKRVDVSEYSDKDKKDLILKQPVGTLLEINGHIMVYLGEFEGEPYVIQQAYSAIAEDESEVINTACVFVSSLDIKRVINKKTFLSEIRTVNAIEM